MRFWRRAAPPPQTHKDTAAPEDLVTALRESLEQTTWNTVGPGLEQALHSHPKDAALLLLKARLLRRENKPQAAMAVCDEVLAHTHEPGVVQLEIAECLLAMTDLPGAIDALQVAVTLTPSLGEAWLRLGEIFMRLDRHGEAIEALVEATKLNETSPSAARSWYVLGQAQHVTGHADAAITCYERCLAVDPKHLDALSAMGHAKLWIEDEPGALQYYEAATALTAAPSRQLLLNLAAARQNVGDFARARSVFEHLLATLPADYNARWYMCQLDLLECRWKEGWANYGARFGAGASPYRPMPFRPWDGNAHPQDCLLILADQGIGDEIMFASCFEPAIQRLGHTVIECEPRLLRLFERSFPTAHFVSTQRENTAQWLAEAPQPDWQIASGDLPGLFRLDEAAFSPASAYLKADPERTECWRDRLERELGPGLKVGISWRGGTSRTRTRARSLGPHHWAPILGTPDVHFVNLQYGHYQDELTELNARYGTTIHDYPEAITDYDETAALVSALDVVVTVCTAIVHLSGALGTPVWVLTPHSPGWRYTAYRHELPWYPRSRLFRQPQWGAWEPACQELSAALRDLTLSVAPHSDST